MTTTRKEKNTYLVSWYNGYYNVTKPIVSKSHEEALSLAKTMFSASRGFKMGENPPINCGVYGEPWIEGIV